MNKEAILHKYDDALPEGNDPFEKKQYALAKKALRLLAKVVPMLHFQKHAVLSILHLSRTAKLTLEERQCLFGKALEDALFEKVMEGNDDALLQGMLDAIERKDYCAAAKLAGDVSDWETIFQENLLSFEDHRAREQGLLCLLSYHFGKCKFEDADWGEITARVQKGYPGIEAFFALL